MSAKLMVVALTVLGPVLAGETLTFTHVVTPQEVQEIATVLHSIADVQVVSDETPTTLSVQGTSEQVGLAGWIFNELDRPANQPAVLEYRMRGVEDNVVRIFYLPYAKPVQEFQEVVTAVRSIADIRRMFTFGAPRAVVVRGTEDQNAVAEWLFNELAKPADKSMASQQYSMPGAKDDFVQVFYTPHTPTIQQFQEVATLIRSLGDIRRLFTNSDSRAMVARGSSDQLSLAHWLVKELDKPIPPDSASDKFRMSETLVVPDNTREAANTVRVFYLPQMKTVEEFQQVVKSVQAEVNVRRAFTYNTPRAVAVRGTSAQIGQAERLFAERSSPN